MKNNQNNTQKISAEIHPSQHQIEKIKKSIRELHIRAEVVSSQTQDLRLTQRKIKAAKSSLMNSPTWKIAKFFALLGSFFGAVQSFKRREERLNKRISILNKQLKALRTSLQYINSDLIALGSERDLMLIHPEFIDLSKVKKVRLMETKEPLVSIIIPAYNQANYTTATILSIAKFSGENVPYEVILIDDCSPNQDANQLHALFENLVFIRNESNLGFLKNCNKAALEARGKYVLFLNNDTNVQPNWLEPLVDIMENEEDTGMVGSRLVFPNGIQQEAGGIIWKDGSGWNYGRNDDPGKPEYNYVKDADYVSGASIMIRKKLWDDLGGFDERYAPAYFEDTDIAFEIRKSGYKVKYQPQSWVVHYEGISHGKDEDSGIKEYQKLNREKFVEKWGEELQNNFENAQSVFLARDRGQFKKTILIIDHYVPQFDQDAGSRSIFSYIKLFVSKGFNVKFLGDNYYNDPIYAPILQQMGVEVLFGNQMKENLNSWMEQNGEFIQYVFVNRPHITKKYLDVLREFTSAKVLYYGHDLHFLREQREYAITANSLKKDDAKKWEKIEFEIMKNVDVSFFPSFVEVELVRSMNAKVNVHQIPVYIYDEFPNNNFQIGQDLMFLGGFSHPPNVDAVLWFVSEIWPAVKAKYSNIKFYVVGSNPTDEIKELATEDIIITGFVTDNELKEYYSNCRLAIVPLRFGAGIKGKVIEALHQNIPLISTVVGAEGLKDIGQSIAIVDAPQKFAEKINELYNDKEELSRMAKSGQKYCQEYFSTDAALRALSKHIDFNGKT